MNLSTPYTSINTSFLFRVGVTFFNSKTKPLISCSAFITTNLLFPLKIKCVISKPALPLIFNMALVPGNI